MIELLGLPYDGSSSFLRGAAKAPAHIRAALHSASANLGMEAGGALDSTAGWRDGGDLSFGEPADQPNLISSETEARDPASQVPSVRDVVTAAVDERLSRGVRTLCLGGDHSLAYPIVRAYAKHFRPLTVVQFDAHSDLYDEFEGDRYSHACPFARIMEEGLADRLVQIGIRTQTPALRAQARRFGVEVIEMRDMERADALELHGPVYLSLDLDVLDPAFAPGVSHHEPGGLTTRELIRMLQRIDVPVVGADIVELNPDRDQDGLTSMVAAKLLREVLSKML